MNTEMGVLRDYLAQRRMRFTPERGAIVKEIFSRHDHFTVEELYLALRSKRRISRASIYRTIPILIDAGLVAEVFQEEGQTLYEHTFGHEHHCHLRCSQCGKVVEFSAPGLAALESKMADEHGFAISGHRLEIFGVCPACQGSGS
jgi:Fur family ferric uptake transcriptional regulator